MTIAFFPQNLILDIPKGIFLVGIVGILVAGIVEFRQGHIGRVAIFLNALLLWQIFFPVWELLPNWWCWYLNVGSIAGVTALISYFPLTRFKLPSEIYTFCFYAYGSLSIIFVIFLSLYLKTPLW